MCVYHRVQTEWQRPLSGVHSIMIEKWAQAGEGGECTPSPFHYTVFTITYAPAERHTVKKIYRIPVFFFTKPFRNGKTPMLTRDFLCPPEKEFFVFWGGKSIPLSAGVIFSSQLNVIFPYFPYFPIKFTGKLLEDSWLATGVPGRGAIKFGHWEKNSAPFVKLQVWNSLKF